SDKRSASPAKPHGIASLESRKRVLSFVLVASPRRLRTPKRIIMVNGLYTLGFGPRPLAAARAAESGECRRNRWADGYVCRPLSQPSFRPSKHPACSPTSPPQPIAPHKIDHRDHASRG